MKFKLDENFGKRTQQLFHLAGHDVHTVSEEGLQGATDEEIFAACCTEQRFLVTLDLDFSDVVRFPPTQSDGIAIIRVSRNPSLQLLEQMIKTLLTYLAQSSSSKQLLIVEPGRIRIHQSPDR